MMESSINAAVDAAGPEAVIEMLNDLSSQILEDLQNQNTQVDNT